MLRILLTGEAAPMGRPGLGHHPKFARAMHVLSETRAHIRGHLELLWEVAYECGNPRIGDVTDIELAAGWEGEPGKLCKALLECGGNGHAGFIEEIPDEPGHYEIHDLYDHSPEYVRKRMDRENVRKSRGTTLSELRAEAGRKGAAAKWATTDSPENDNCLANGNGCHSAGMANGTTPTPAPAPTPAPTPALTTPIAPSPMIEHGDGGGEIFSDWKEASKVALSVCRGLGRQPPAAEADRRLLLRVAAVSLTAISDSSWLTDAIEATKAAKAKMPLSYLRKCLATGADDRGHNLGKLLARIDVPPALLVKAPSKPQAAGDAPPVPAANGDARRTIAELAAPVGAMLTEPPPPEPPPPPPPKPKAKPLTKRQAQARKREFLAGLQGTVGRAAR